jgi:hypothetical protein
LSNKPIEDGPTQRAKTVQRAEASLVTAVERMRRRLHLNRDTPAIVKDIKNTMHACVPSHGYTVLKALCDRERQKAFNRQAAVMFPEYREAFEHRIRDSMSGRDKKSARKVRSIARNAWKEDPAADRRIREMEKLPPDLFRSPYRGQPERYDPEVVLAFENTIADAIGLSRIAWTRETTDGKSSGVILDVFVAAVQWATCFAWRGSAPPGTDLMKVRAEGLLRIVKAARRKKATN